MNQSVDLTSSGEIRNLLKGRNFETWIRWKDSPFRISSRNPESRELSIARENVINACVWLDRDNDEDDAEE